MSFKFNIPIYKDNKKEDVSFQINNGETIFILGKNGSGKSSLISHISRTNHTSVNKISALRSNIISSGKQEMVGHQVLHSIQRRVDSNLNISSRYSDQTANEYPLLTVTMILQAEMKYLSDQAIARRTNDLTRENELLENPTPIEKINSVLFDCGLDLKVEIQNGTTLFISKRGNSYEINQASDGERNLLLLCADVICATSGSPIIIDEPEKHLHNSIIPIMLRSLINQRTDCPFIISTHNIEVTSYFPNSRVFCLRRCEFENSYPNYWDLDIVESSDEISDEHKIDIIGGRRKIIFVEGTDRGSLDKRFFEILLPQHSIISKGSCSKIYAAVKSLRDNINLAWLSVSGIIDADYRTEQEISELKDQGVYCLPYHSIESLIYHPYIIDFLAKKQSEIIGYEVTEKLTDLRREIFEELKSQKQTHTNQRMRHIAKRLLADDLEKKIKNTDLSSLRYNINLEVTVESESLNFDKNYDRAISDKDFEFFLKNCSLRRANLTSLISKKLGFSGSKTYEDAAFIALRKDPGLRSCIEKEIKELISQFTIS